LLNQELDFEETSIDYCVTYEVSPPPFVAPKKSKVVTAVVEPVQQDPSSNRYVMPDTIKGATSELLREIVDYSTLHQPAGLDCSNLKRVDFTAAGQLLNGLAPITGNGKVIQFHEVNHLVTALFHVMGINNIAQIYPRKY
jgi:ABC-type transporter Mla MlaB component